MLYANEMLGTMGPLSNTSCLLFCVKSYSESSGRDRFPLNGSAIPLGPTADDPLGAPTPRHIEIQIGKNKD